jgi:N-acetylneuraminic acid mutarotase
MSNKIQIKRGAKANLPILDPGELALCTDTNEVFVGNNSNVQLAKQNDVTANTFKISTLENKILGRNYYAGTTSGSSTSYTASVVDKDYSSYFDNLTVTIVPHVDCGTSPTLNLDGLGALPIKNGSNSLSAGDLKANIPYVLVRIGNSFFIKLNSSSSSSSYVFKNFVKSHFLYTGATVPANLIGTSTIQYNNKVYVFGGNNAMGGNPFNTLRILDIQSNTWSLGQTLTLARYMSGAVLYKDKIYIIGGLGNSSSLISTIDVYDPNTNTYGTSITMPSGIYYAACEVYNDKLYIIGGSTGAGVKTSMIYDFISKTWSMGANMSVARYGMSHAVDPTSGKIYIVGGSGGNTLTEVYDCNTNTVTTLANLSNFNYFGTAQYYNGNIYCFYGCYSDSIFYNCCYIYSISNNSWTSQANNIMPDNRAYSSSCMLDNNVIFIGGYTSTGAYPNSTVVYTI